MVERFPLDDVFHALAHEARRDMLDRLAARDLTIGELAEPLPMSFAAASKHVIVLERANLIDRTVEGRRHRCRLRTGALEPVDAWLRSHERYWTGRLDALAELMARPDDR